MTGEDIARELARIDLPLSTYTQWYWKIDLHNLLHFLTLRVDTHAQWEIQEFGRVMAGMLKRVAPLSYEAWIDYDVCGAPLSRMELDALRACVEVKDGSARDATAQLDRRRRSRSTGLGHARDRASCSTKLDAEEPCRISSWIRRKRGTGGDLRGALRRGRSERDRPPTE